MDNEQEFEALINRIGFNDALKLAAITTQGITTCNDLADLSESELEDIYRENRNQNRRRTVNN